MVFECPVCHNSKFSSVTPDYDVFIDKVTGKKQFIFPHYCLTKNCSFILYIASDTSFANRRNVDINDFYKIKKDKDKDKDREDKYKEDNEEIQN